MGPLFKKEFSLKEELDSKSKENLNLNQQSIIIKQLNQVIIQLNYQKLIRYNKVINQLSRFIINFEIYIKNYIIKIKL